MALFTVFTGLLIAAFAWLGLRPGITDAPATAWLVWGMAAAGYLGAAFVVLRKSNTRIPLWAVLATALLLRCAAWSVPPKFTTDHYRYIWDARVAAAGINPFRYAPADPATIPLRHAPGNAVFNKINHKQVPTIYGPAAQILFGAARAALGEDPARWRIIFFGADAATVLLIAALLGALGLPRAWCAVYALHPLVLLDFNANLHLDAVLTACIAGSILCAVRKQIIPAALVLAAAALMKYFPLLFLPLVAGLATRDIQSMRARVARMGLCAAVFGAAVCAGYLPYMRGGVDVFAGLKSFSREFTATAWSPYWLAARAGGRGFADALMAAALCASALWCLAPGSAAARLQRAFWVAAALVLFTPVQRP